MRNVQNDLLHCINEYEQKKQPIRQTAYKWIN